jgi:magnesium transporter
MLSSTLLRAFATPVTYGLVIVLLGTAVMQVRYVNKALQKFDSTQVIPIQFVMFTLSVIIGSAVLYRDFERTTTEQALKFVGGCLLTFFGVFLITSGRSSSDDEDQLSDEEGVEETIGLLEQEATAQQGIKAQGAGAHHQQQPLSTRSSRRSSRTSRVSFVDTSVPGQPFSVQRDSGVPSVRRFDASRDSPREEAGPILENPWQNASDGQISALGLPSAFSEDSVPTLNSLRSPTSVPAQQIPPITSTTSLPPSLAEPPSSTTPDQASVTPRHSFSTASRPHSHYSNNFISPSPLSSTVSAVVADALLRGEDPHVVRRAKSLRRMRPSIRASLFVPQDEEQGEPHEEESLLRSVSVQEGADPQDEQSRRLLNPKNIRGRARSLSNTLGELFGRRKGASTRDATNSDGSDGPSLTQDAGAIGGNHEPGEPSDR